MHTYVYTYIYIYICIYIYIYIYILGREPPDEAAGFEAAGASLQAQLILVIQLTKYNKQIASSIYCYY